MRTIKFRVWDGQQMRDPGELGARFIPNIGIVTAFPEGESLQPDTMPVWMQFTGLYDADGTEIYEGDRVLNALDQTGHILWNDISACWMVEFKEWKTSLNRPFAKTFRVVGNIHEHAHLLET